MKLKLTTFGLLALAIASSNILVACDEGIITPSDEVGNGNGNGGGNQGGTAENRNVYTYTPQNSPDEFEVLEAFTDEFDNGFQTSKWQVINQAFPTWDFKTANVKAVNKGLDFTIKHDPRSNRSNGNSGFTYADDVYFSSGMLRSFAKTTYGYYEVRMKGTNLQPNAYYNKNMNQNADPEVTKNMGACPAFWLYSDVQTGRNNISRTPATNIYYNEIDVIELNQVPKQPYTMSQNLHLMTWEGGGYFASAEKHPVTGITRKYNCEWDSSEDYHIYACENRPDSIILYIDNERVGAKVNSFWHLDEEVNGGMWVTLSLGLRNPFEYYQGSSRCARQTTKAEATAAGFPATMSVDYVRAWKRKSDYQEFKSSKRDWRGKNIEE